MSDQDDAREALYRYSKVVEKFLKEPGFVERMAQQSSIGINAMLSDLFAAFDLPYPILESIHLDRYEEMNDADKQMLRDMGIEP